MKAAGRRENELRCLLARQPEHIRIEKKKKNKADGEEVHIEAEEDACLEEVPLAFSHTAEGISAADESKEGGNDKERGSAVGGESREQVGRCQADKDEYAASEVGGPMRVEDAGSHAFYLESSSRSRIGHERFRCSSWVTELHLR